MWSSKRLYIKHLALTTRSWIGEFPKMKYLNQIEAINIDLELFNEYKFSVDQLMELAGLSCAHAVQKCFPLNSAKTAPSILFCVGPGNNGGDGLVTARHLALMGYKSEIYYPVKTDKELYRNLLAQCKSFNIEEVTKCPTVEEVNSKYEIVVDALFGFSFKPPIRPQFMNIMNVLYATTLPIASIDIPSGWHVEIGPNSEYNIQPKLLISLTAPKMCASYYKGKHHYLGGRFVPPALAQKYDLNLTEYHGCETCVRL